MANIELQNVFINFPIYNVNTRSLKKNFLRLATGGKVSTDANKHLIVHSLNNITLSLNDGDRIGLIGHNGAGKSTFLKLLATIYEPTSGRIQINGKVSTLLNILHNIELEFTGYENIIQRGIILGLRKKNILHNISKISELTGLGSYLHMPVRTYSSGMMVRLAFAISTSINPEILLIDEIFGTGDADFMEKSRNRMIELVNNSNIVVIASHSDALIKEFCNKVLLLESGYVKFFGDVQVGFQLYKDSVN